MAQDWIDRGMIVIDEYDDGSGWKKVRAPFWQLKSTFWWRATFPANADVHVSHRYTPSVGGSAGLTFFSEGRLEGPGYEGYKAKYCLDADFDHAVRRAAKESPDGYPRLYETRISYILTTGGNWATGSIGDFTLTIDKGDPEALVSFCGEGVRKIGPTTFQMKAKDFYPEHDVDMLILKPTDWDRERSSRADADPQDGAQAGARRIAVGRLMRVAIYVAIAAEWRDRARRRPAVAAVERSQALQGRHDGQAGHHGPQDLGGHRQAVARDGSTSSSRATGSFRAEGAETVTSLAGCRSRWPRCAGAAWRAWTRSASSAAARSTGRRMALADRLHVTHVLADVEGDTTFPPIDPASVADRAVAEDTPAGERDSHATRYTVYERRPDVH